MATNKITNAGLKNIKPDSKERIISDGAGLYVRVRSLKDGGAKSFRLKYKFEDKQRWLTIGSYPLMSLTDARAKRDEYKRMIQDGQDPSVRRAINKERTIYQERKKLTHASAQNNQLTLDEFFSTFKGIYLAKKHKDKGKYASNNYYNHVSPHIGSKFVKEITVSDIHYIVDIMLSKDISCMAKSVFTLVRQVFNIAIERGVLKSNPTAPIKKSSINPKKSERDRVLSDEELKQLAKQIPKANLPIKTEYAIWLMLSTGCRIGELIKNSWENVDLKKKTFYIPKELAKNKMPYTISLSDFALHYFNKLHNITGQSHWIYPQRNNPLRHTTPASIRKLITDRQKADPSKRLSGRTRLFSALKVGNEEWTPHDLRRTMATIMARYRTPENIIDKCLNHVTKNGVIHVYVRYDYLLEMQEAWDKAGSHLSNLLELDDLSDKKRNALTNNFVSYDSGLLGASNQYNLNYKVLRF